VGLFVNADVLRTDGGNQAATYGATAASAGGLFVLVVKYCRFFHYFIWFAQYVYA